VGGEEKYRSHQPHSRDVHPKILARQAQTPAIILSFLERWSFVVMVIPMMAQFVKTPNRATIRAGSSFPDSKMLDKAERT
jgi:hypothetical protein